MDITKLRQYEQDGLLYCQSHPVHPLLIWNYSPRVQYEQLWDEITLIARGLVTDLDGNIVSSGFPKFFNIEENRHIPTDEFEIFEKLDGQYIGVFWYNGEMIVNSRGSFTSPYALEAKRILDEKYPALKLYLPNWISFCFELIGFEQIVVSYPEPDLVLTGMFNRENLLDLNLKGNELYLRGTGLQVVKKYSGLDYKNIKQLNWQNSEGFVVRFSNGDRCKIKFEDYIKLHRQMTNLSTTAIWEALMEGKPVSSILSDVPDEFYTKVHEYEHKLKSEYECWENHCRSLYDSFSSSIQSRSIFAECAKKTNCSGILFAMLDGKDYSKQIWKLIKPNFEKI